MPLTPPTVTLGKRKKKNWFMPGMMIAQIMPMTQTRRDETGMEGSSVFATAERTSGYGESSSVDSVVRCRYATDHSLRTKENGILVNVRVVEVRYYILYFDR